MSEALRLVERFTLTDANTLRDEVTVHDPQTWTWPWTVAFPLARDVPMPCTSTHVTKATPPSRTSSEARAAEK